MTSRPDRWGERGMALVLTLLVLVLLVTAVLEFDRSTRTMVKAAGNFRDGMKAFHLATSGIAAAQALLKDDRVRHGSRDDLTELWATPLPPYPLGDGTVAVWIQDEGGKINVNALVAPNGARQRARIEQLRALFRLKEQDPAPVDAIVDWLDPDDIEEPAGAESAYYERLDQPYRCRNGRMDTLAELHLVKGITDEVYLVISPYLTVYPRDASAPKINLNTADPVVIRVSPATENGVPVFLLDAAQVDRLVTARPLSKLNDLDTLGLDPRVVLALKQDDRLTSDVFSVYAEGEVNGVKKGVLAVVDRSRGEPVLKYWRLAD